MTEQTDNPQQESPSNEDTALNTDDEKSTEDVIEADVSSDQDATAIDMSADENLNILNENALEHEAESGKDIDTDSNGPETPSDNTQISNTSEELISSVTFPQLEVSVVDKQDHPDLLNNVDVDLSVELGRKDMTVEEVSSIKVHDVIELPKLAGEAFEIRINGRIFAVGDVVIIGQNMAVRLTSMINPGDQLK